MGSKRSPRIEGDTVPVFRILAGAVVTLFIIVWYGHTANGSEPLRSFRNGDVMIGMLLPMHSASTNDDACRSLSIQSIFVLEAILYTIKRKNRTGRELNGMIIGYDVRDTCYSISIAMKQSIDIIATLENWSKAKEGGRRTTGFAVDSKPDPVSSQESNECQKPIMGIIGGSGSAVGIALAALLSYYKVPFVSYHATSASLSHENTSYPSFYRTIPSDDKQAIAMVDVITHFGWNYVASIASDDEYGREGIRRFMDRAKKRNICFALDAIYDPADDDRLQQVTRIIVALKENPKVKVIVLFMYWEHAKLFVDEAERHGLEGKTWIACQSWSEAVELLRLPPKIGRGIIGLTVPSHFQEYPAFKKYVSKAKLHKRVKDNPWLSLYTEAKFNCTLAHPDGQCKTGNRYDPGAKVCPLNWTLGHLMPSPETLSITTNAANALIVLVEAMKAAIANESETLKQNKWFNHEDLNRYVAKVDFPGAGGERIRFDNHGDFVGAQYEVMNVQEKDGELVRVNVGSWEMDEGPGRLSMNDELIQWNEGVKPDSRCSAACQPGEFMQPSPSECCWRCQKCPKGSISSTDTSLQCYPCPYFFHTNQNQSECFPNEEICMYHHIIMRIALVAMGSIGLTGVIVTMIIITVFRKLAVIRRVELRYTFLVVVMAAQVYPFSFSVCPLTTSLCTLQVSLFLMPAAMLPVILMSQTAPALRISRRALWKVFRKETSRTVQQFCIFTALALVSLGFCLLAFANGLPSVHRDLVAGDESKTLLSCEDPFWKAGAQFGLIPVGSQAALLILAAFIYERDKEILKDQTYNGVICYILVLTAAVIIPVYFAIDSTRLRIMIVAIGNFIGHMSITCLRFLPQMYAIFIEKDRTVLVIKVTDDQDSMDQSVVGQEMENLLSAQLDDSPGTIKDFLSVQADAAHRPKVSVSAQPDDAHRPETAVSAQPENGHRPKTVVSAQTSAHGTEMAFSAQPDTAKMSPTQQTAEQETSLSLAQADVAHEMEQFLSSHP